VRNITQRKKAEESLKKSKEDLEQTNKRLRENQAQLIQVEKMAALGQIAAGVAHEINNPVGFVASNLTTLTEYVEIFKNLIALYEALVISLETANDIKRKEILEEIAKLRSDEDLAYITQDVNHLLSESADGTNRVKEIVQGLKSFARLDESELKDANINEGIEATLRVIWNELKYKCQVHKKLGQVPLIRCYPGQLNQVVLNLLVNAAQAISTRGEITIETEANETHIIIRISDTGKGIAPEHLSKIFTPFFTTKPVGKGTGLGLSISYGIVQKHKGTIEVESTPGKGTTFTILLPLEGAV
jgi:signal transduction histidine kinase